MKQVLPVAIASALLGGTLALAGQQGAAAKKLLVKSPPSGNRKLVYLAKNSSSTVIGDPATNGATFVVQLSPGSPQCLVLPASGWSATPVGFKYRDAALANGPVKVALIKATPAGTFLLKVVAKGPALPLVPGGPTTSYATNFQLGGADEYCADTGTATPTKNDAGTFLVKNDTGTTCTVSASGVCNLPTTTTTIVAETSTTTTTVPTTMIRINEVNANITGGCDLIELRVFAGGNIGGYTLQERDTQVLVTFPAGFSPATNDIIVVHLNGTSATCNPLSATMETASVFQQPSASFPGNYDTAYDFWSADSGLSATDNVLTLYDAGAAIVDAVFLANASTGTTAAATETQAAAVAAAGQWQQVGGGVPPGGFVDDDFRMNAVLDLDGTGTTPAGNSIQRLDDTDDNDKADWNSAPTSSTWGVLNVGQSPQ